MITSCKRGFSFIEIMVVVFIFALIGSGVFQVFSVGNRVYTNELALLDLQAHARNAIDRMVRDIRASSSVTVTAVSTDVDRITFTKPSATGVQYYLSGTNLVREYPSGTTKIIAGNIVRLKFTQSGSVLTIDLRATQTVSGKVFTHSMKEKVRLRNG
jgi:prepilin-type N-terminal cleavage/methylation domain-containing protein